MADTRWVRLKTIYYAIAVAMLGHIIMIIAAVPGVIEHESGALACFSVGLIFFGIGVGGFKPNVSLVFDSFSIYGVLTIYSRSRRFTPNS